MNKAIIEFGFRRILKILQFSEGVFHLGLLLLWITLSLICRILHILRKPNSIIAKYLFIFPSVHFALEAKSLHKV